MALRTRVKICGITRAGDGVEAARLGVDAIGLVFYEKSPRYVTIQQAKDICQALPGFVSIVSLFMDADAEQVQSVLDECPIDLLQFHGRESADYCLSFGRPYIKAVGMADIGHPGGHSGDHLDDWAGARAADQLEQSMKTYAAARALLLDSHATGVAGGTGQSFDWQRIPAQYRQKIMLAGGLNPDNVAQAIQQVRPYAVDLSSGVESAPGVKDIELMTRLMTEVKRVDCENQSND